MNHLLAVAVGLVGLGAIIGTMLGTPPQPAMRPYLIALGVVAGLMALASCVSIYLMIQRSNDRGGDE
ncbi:MAG: hypothetical protein AB1725_03105 [Armatimonadota bacterium]